MSINEYRLIRNDLLNASRRVRHYAESSPAWCAVEVRRLQKEMARARRAVRN